MIIILSYIKYHCNNYKLYKETELTRNVRFRSMEWVGHVMGMKEERVPKKALIGYKKGKAQRGVLGYSGQGY
jgi:hypothetical protein